MYTIFVNDKPIILTNKPKTDLGYEVYMYREIRFEEVLHKLRHSKVKGICLYYNDLEYLFSAFKNYFTVVDAAGGLVLKNQREILCIFRNNRWDLPKGKMEPGETAEESALREVSEECGIHQLSIIKPLEITYHFFYENNLNKLKITRWFLMETADHSKPKPQREEGITEAKFIPIQSISELYSNMYANIKNLIINFLN